MSSVIDLTSQVINDDYSRISPLLKLIASISDEPKDPLKAAHRSEVIKFLCTHTPEFDSFCDEVLKCAESTDGEDEEPDKGGPLSH